MAREVLLTLVATPQIEERLVDWLLANGHSGFTTVAAAGHGAEHGALDTREQVTGRKVHVALWLVVPRAVADALLGSLAEAFAGAEIHYWVTDVVASGALAGRGSDGGAQVEGRGAGRTGDDPDNS